ncbi:MAG: PDZ domain-containing protein [Planctomycetes bacterium]|nr:PDZ domain-containing protein [Planctomycetota bacterium]
MFRLPPPQLLRFLVLTLCTALVPLAAILAGGDEKDDDKLSPAKAAEVVGRWSKQIVPVEIWFKKFEGDPPAGHQQEFEEKRPMEVAALAVDPATLWLPDPELDPRAIARMAAGADRIPARLHGYFLQVPGWILSAENPLAGVDALKFVPASDAGAEGDLLGLKATLDSGSWTFSVSPVGKSLQVRGPALWSKVEAGLLLLTAKGDPAGYTFASRLPIQGQPENVYANPLWRGADLAAAPVLTVQALDKLSELFVKKAAGLIPTVKIIPRKEEEADESEGFHRAFSRRFRGMDTEPNDLFASGLAVGPRQVLVDFPLDRELAIRMEQVKVIAGGEERPARFIGAFKRFGAFLVEVEKDLPAHLDLGKASSYSLYQPLLAVSADHATGKRRDWVDFNRVSRFEKGYRNVLEAVSARFPRRGALFFSMDQELAGAAIEVRRDDDGDESFRPSFSRRQFFLQRGRSFVDLRLFTIGDLKELLDKAPQNFDPRLVPRPAEREKDMVWFGIEFQPLNRELARNQGVEIATRGGEIGLLALHVYPNSPAAKAQIEPGDILLSIRDLEEPEPYELHVTGEEATFSSFMDHIGEDIPDEVEEQMLAQMPAPWRSPRNFLNNKLTEIGEGNEVEVAYLHKGEEKKLRLKLEIGPPDFENAPKEKLEEIGLTVKDLTYEVRRHYRLRDDAPGVVVQKVESGSKAAVAKIGPYEIITSMSGQAVASAKDFHQKFDALMKAGKKDLELKVERLGKSRLVKIRL